MSLPTFTLEVGFVAGPLDASPIFTNLAADLETLAVSRGRQGDSDQAQTGIANATLLDDGRRYDPDNTAGTYYPNVQVMKPVRVLATLDAVTYKVFYGWIDVQNGWVRIENEAGVASVLVPCNDGFEILNNGRVFTRTLTLDYFDAVIAAGPSLYWRLNETVGVTTAADSSGSGNTGAYGTGTTRGGVAAPINDTSAFSTAFDDTASAWVTANAYKLGSADQLGLGPFTVMGWAKRTATTNADPLFGLKNARPSLCLSSGSQNVTWQPQSASTVATWAAAWPGTGTWVHWALTYNSATKTAELFINGVSQGALTTSLGLLSAPTFSVGAAQDTAGANAYWNGSLDEVAAYESVLSGATIAGIYAARLQAPPSVAVPAPGCTLAQELTGTRINNILGIGPAGSIGIGSIPQWPTAWRSIDPGNAQMQSVTQANDVSSVSLQMIRDAETTEPGFFYFDGRGYACFRDRRSRPLAVSQATFCDTHNLIGGRILYDSVTTRRTAIVNDARATRSGGVLQEAADAASQGVMLTRAQDYSTQHVDDASALDYAKWLLSLKKDSYEVLETLTLRPGTDSPTWVQVLSRELNDRITVVRTPPPGTGVVVTRDYFIEKIDINWGPGPDASCVWRLSPASQFNYWLAGTAGSSEAGTTTRAAY